MLDGRARLPVSGQRSHSSKVPIFGGGVTLWRRHVVFHSAARSVHILRGGRLKNQRFQNGRKWDTWKVEVYTVLKMTVASLLSMILLFCQWVSLISLLMHLGIRFWIGPAACLFVDCCCLGIANNINNRKKATCCLHPIASKKLNKNPCWTARATWSSLTIGQTLSRTGYQGVIIWRWHPVLLRSS